MATRISGLLLCVAGSFVVSAASAQDVTKIHNFSIAAEASSYEYKEPGLMKLSGTLYGVTAEYLNNGGVGRIKESMPVQLRARLTYMQGNDLEYDGKLLGSGAPFKRDGEHIYYYDVIFAAGFGIKATEKLFISPYLGVGYRYHLDKDDGIVYDKANSVYVVDPKREQTYYYLPLGADFKIPLGSGWRLAFNTELDLLLRGRNTTTSELSGEHNFRQNSGYGLRASAKIEKHLQSVGFFAEPFYRYWNISKSDMDGIWYEPKNRTQEFGLRIGATF